ncbi:SGM_5486 family transporter-associated protein [Kitasatospora sp. MAP5-34]|nr:SGM_5486 family transporter-associated protein [Kitasatospora sp. MAP5-34]MDH6578507.1 hypothetical protein [Kitasatospora sp. MAP5-34]
MPVLEPNPQDGQKKLLQLMGVIVLIVVAVSIVAVIARNIG